LLSGKATRKKLKKSFHGGILTQFKINHHQINCGMNEKGFHRFSAGKNDRVNFISLKVFSE
jgi:hypothetical protein